MNAILFTRDGCHLCETAYKLLQQHGLSIQCVDIDRDPALVAKFDHCVPVVEIGGKVRFRGRVSEIMLKRLLAAEERQKPRAQD